MTEPLTDRLKNAWNAFKNKSPTDTNSSFYDYGASGYAPYQEGRASTRERSIIAAIYNRIALDCAIQDFRHVQLDEYDNYSGDIPSSLNRCLTLRPNVDQTSQAFIQDLVLSLFDEGNVAIAPIDTTSEVNTHGGESSFDIQSMRIGRIVEWLPQHVRLNLYNDRSGNFEDLVFAKNKVAILENPFYSVMNENNSTVTRLLRKLTLMDQYDESIGANKLDIIMQFPFNVRSDALEREAGKKIKLLTDQLNSNKYGVAYASSSDKITQLNRPLGNAIAPQVATLMTNLYTELGITPEIMNGSASTDVIQNYQHRTIEPILSVITQGLEFAFLTTRAYNSGQRIKYFQDPFALVSIKDLGDVFDKMIRNQILTGNEARAVLLKKAVQSDAANSLINPNMPLDKSTHGIDETQDSSTPIKEEGPDTPA
jgi:hypothetical protein